MSIRKIIHEEISGFDWMENANHVSYEYLNNKALEFNPPITDINSLDNILDTLKDLGFKTFDSYIVVSSDDFFEPVVGLYMGDGNVVWSDESAADDDDYQQHINGYAGKLVEVLNGRNIFDTLIVEGNDFDWAKDTPIRYGNDNMPSIGDKVRTLDGFSNDWDYGAYSKEDDDPMCGGYGYKENYTFIIYDIDDADEVGGDRGIVWPEDGDGGGIYVDAIEPYDAK